MPAVLLAACAALALVLALAVSAGRRRRRRCLAQGEGQPLRTEDGSPAPALGKAGSLALSV